MKKSIAVRIITLTLAVLPSIASADISNGGFESGMTGWTTEYTNDGTNNGYTNQAYVTTQYHHSGTYSLWGYSDIYRKDSYPEYDWSRTYVWSAPQNLSSVTSIKLYLTNFLSNYYDPLNWGWGQEVLLMLDDGTNQAGVSLIDNHESPYASLVDLGLYTYSLGNDTNHWYGFDVPLSENYFAGLSNFDLSSTKVGICWEAISWNSSNPALFAGASVDDIQLVPELATICLLGLGGLALLRKRRACYQF